MRHGCQERCNVQNEVMLLCRPQLVKGFMQLYSVDQRRSQALEAHAAAFSTVSVPGRAAPSTVISFAQKTFNNGTLTSKLHVIELGAPAGQQPAALMPASACRMSTLQRYSHLGRT